jgi:hypothetical protein
MKDLHQSFESLIGQQSILPGLGARLLEKRLAELGVGLNDQQLLELESRLLSLKGDSVPASLEVDQMASVEGPSGSPMPDVLAMDSRCSENDLAALRQRRGARLRQVVADIVDELPDAVLQRLKADAPKVLRRRRKQRQSFEADVVRAWRKPLDLLETMVAVAYKAGDDFSREHRSHPAQANDQKLDALTRLHARACQIASEVLVLLRAGCSDGAHARWRSLHEIAVVAAFIESQTAEIAERYLRYETVESYRAALQYQKHCDILGFEPISDGELRSLQSAHESLKARFGDAYVQENGWAACAFGGKAPRFVHIEERVGLGHTRPFYKMACYNVHAGPKGVFFRLGLPPGSQDTMLAGPSDFGLADPAQGMAISLTQATSALLNTRRSADTVVVSNVLVKLADEVGRECLEVENALKRRGLLP